MILNVSEKQVIIAIKNLLARNGSSSMENLESFGRMFFCSYKKDWNLAFDSLLKKGIIRNENNQLFINSAFGGLSSMLVQKYPRFHYWYNDWYRLAEKSEAHSKLCKSAYGIDLCQTGMVTLSQINYVTENIIGNNKCCLDLGCGSGHISEYIADSCSCTVTGIDLIANGIKIARQRTYNKNHTLQFYLRDMINFTGIDRKFDYILSFDTIYFVGNNLPRVIENSLNMLNCSGKLLIFYSAWNPKDIDLTCNSTVLGEYLNKAGIKYDCVDFTEDDRLHWLLKYEALLKLKELFINEGNKLVFDNRFAEAEFFVRLAKENKLFRYLYIISKDE